MKDQIVQFINDYAPLFAMLILMFVDRFGFGGMFNKFKTDITEALNTAALKSTINTLKKELLAMKDQYLAVCEEIKEERSELKKIRESLTKVKGARK